MTTMVVARRNTRRQFSRSTGGSGLSTASGALGARLLVIFISGFVGYNLCLSNSISDVFLSLDQTPMHATQQLLRSITDPMGAVKAHTYGLLNNIPNKEWEAIRLKTISTSWYGNPQNPLENVENPDLWNEKNMIPNFHCLETEMVPQREAKGETKYVCNPRRLVFDEKKQEAGGADPCLIYSFGCAGDFSFEDEIFKMHNKACEVHIFDPASKWERENDIPNKNIHYHAWGLKSTYDDSKSVVWPAGYGGEYKTFGEIMEELGHKNRIIDILKIDCEGCEWSTYKDWIHLGIRQILIELHGVPAPGGTPEQRWYQKPLDLSEYYGTYRDNGYVLFNKQRNGELSLELGFLKMASDFWKK